MKRLLLLALVLTAPVFAADGGAQTADCKLADGKSGWMVHTPSGKSCVEAASDATCALKDGRPATLITGKSGSFCQLTQPKLGTKCEGGLWKRGADGGMSCAATTAPPSVMP